MCVAVGVSRGLVRGPLHRVRVGMERLRACSYRLEGHAVLFIV